MLVLLLAACAGGATDETTFGGLGSASPSTPSGGSADDTGATADLATTAGPTSPELDTGNADTSADDESTGAPVPNPDGLPNGKECTDPGQCMTDNCYKVPLPVDGLPPGICSECDADMDCVTAGRGTACTVDPVSRAGVCGYGNAGSFCETQAACQKDLLCAELIPGAGPLLPRVCSACQVDTDCGGDLRCIAKLDVANYSGTRSCAVPGTVDPGDLCPLPDGDKMCLSEKCAVLKLADVLDVGVCGQCKSDADCPNSPTKKCDPPKFTDDFVASTCI